MYRTPIPSLFALLLVVSLVPAGSARAELDCERDDLDEFEKLECQIDGDFHVLDQQLDEEFQALDQAINDAYNRLGEEIAAEWGDDDVVLPTQSTYVDYSADKQTRRKINFEEGVVEVERLVDETGDVDAAIDAIYKEMNSLSKENMDDLAERDIAARYARQDMQSQGYTTQQIRHKNKKPVLAGVAKVPAKKDFRKVVRTSQTSTRKKKVVARVPLKTGHLSEMANRYQQSVLREARKQGLPPSLVFAIMETESHFNPRAKSHIPAFGLMQLVPRSGGIDAYNFVYKKKRLLEPEYLYDAAQNVELGAAYLKLVNSKYLRHITDDTSRMYCTIAAYNTGAGNVARSFIGTNNAREASKVINTMTSQEVYNHLIKKLPYEETRRYVQKVLKAKRKYEAVDQYATL